MVGAQHYDESLGQKRAVRVVMKMNEYRRNGNGRSKKRGYSAGYENY